MNLAIRPAEPRDYADYAALMPELRVDDPIPSPEIWIRDLLPTTLVAELDGQVVGYLYHQIFGDVGYVRNVVSAPGHRRIGVGRALMGAARAEFVRRGATAWCLNVKPDNTSARALYEALGFQLAHKSVALRIDWTQARRLNLVASSADVASRIVSEDDDVAVESALGLLSGQLRTARRQQDRVIMGLFLTEVPVGLAVFNPHYPGCFPFRVAGPKYLGPLLAAIEPHKRAADEWVQVVIEGQDESAAALLAAGAEVRLEILNLRGPL